MVGGLRGMYKAVSRPGIKLILERWAGRQRANIGLGSRHHKESDVRLVLIPDGIFQPNERHGRIQPPCGRQCRSPAAKRRGDFDHLAPVGAVHYLQILD